MRAQRQKIKLLELGGADEDEIIIARGRYMTTSSEYTRFSKVMGLPQQRERVTVDNLYNIGQKNYYKPVEKSTESGIINTGARITDLLSEEAEKFANMYYEEIRHFSTDTRKIASNLGESESNIRKVKAYLFEDKSFYNPDSGEWERFDPDCAIAQSWQRLMLGRDIKSHDRALIKHELFEMEIKKDNPHLSHLEAHTIATKKYNYQKEAEEYYDSVKKNKKNK